MFGLDEAADAEAGRIPIDDAGHSDRFARESAGHIRHRSADANAAALDAGALARILVVIRFFAVLVMAGLMISVAMTLHARLGRDGGRHSSPGHAARDEGERDEQNDEPSPQGLHYQDATIRLHTGQMRPCHRRVVRRCRALLITSTELRLMAALAIIPSGGIDGPG